MFLEYVQLQNLENKEYHYLMHSKQFNEFQYQNNHEDLWHMPHALFYQANYL